MKGQKFNLNLDADNFEFNIPENESGLQQPDAPDVIKEIQERHPGAPPSPPKLKTASKSGFPEHRSRKVSAFKQRQQATARAAPDFKGPISNQYEPSDRAIAHQIGKKYGFDTQAKEKADIGEENKQKLAHMSVDEIEQARAELLANLNPTLIERLLKRANIDEDKHDQDWEVDHNHNQEPHIPINPSNGAKTDLSAKHVITSQETTHPDPNVNPIPHQSENQPIPPPSSSTHFPVPPRDPSNYQSLDPNSSTFLSDLRIHYFPDTPHDPNTMSWLQDTTEEEASQSAYAPTQTSYAPSDIRFDFTGRLLPPSESSSIPVDKGLHHHGDAPSSAGYTIPELSLLARSTLPNQRCMAYRTLGRILFRLGRGDYGPRGTELNEGLWGCVEHERPVEVMMAEANRTGGHVSAKTYATEALWLWRKGGGGDRGVLKPGERIAK